MAKAKAKTVTKKTVEKAPAAKGKSEKKEYKTEAAAKAQQVLWERKGFKVSRRKNVLYLSK